ncbi:CBO0543 family protein [Cytobacillus oceanisediminis]|uniref:CBO0543 family protein n=1 Tax=Cytobacillus oceanisediminis TaxID=665099 RepID=UPI001FB439B4|nr:CBO0543 family protein [Cytobacillus oceanisediminis]UOE58023.1 hypothetical protein IRB79_27555 [Cytobacillus oceanisediminis]
MNKERIEDFQEIMGMQRDSHLALTEYWKQYELYTSFEYWLMAAFLIAPLIILFFKIDKEKIFLVGFYGYSIHIMFGYHDLLGRNLGYWNYPIPLIPHIPGLALDSSLVPVIFMLIYQWTLNHQKNFYLYSLLAAAIMSFVFKPMLVSLGIFELQGKANYLYLFISYIIVFLFAKFATAVFLWAQKKYGKARYL